MEEEMICEAKALDLLSKALSELMEILALATGKVVTSFSPGYLRLRTNEQPVQKKYLPRARCHGDSEPQEEAGALRGTVARCDLRS